MKVGFFMVDPKIISELDRFKQFLTLYDLGQLYDRDILKRAHNTHLMGLVGTNKRLRMLKIESVSTKE